LNIPTDLIESCFLVGALYVSFRSAWRIYASQSLDGVYWPAWAFYAVYEIWKLIYYSHFDQAFSFFVNIAMVSTNFLAFIGIAKVYRNKSRK